MDKIMVRIIFFESMRKRVFFGIVVLFYIIEGLVIVYKCFIDFEKVVNLCMYMKIFLGFNIILVKVFIECIKFGLRDGCCIFIDVFEREILKREGLKGGKEKEDILVEDRNNVFRDSRNKLFMWWEGKECFRWDKQNCIDIKIEGVL